jgi:membrane associated rhomboid family serine protease
MILLILAFIYAIFCIKISIEGERRKIGFNITYFISLFLTPVVSGLVILFFKKKNDIVEDNRAITPIVGGLIAMNFIIFVCEFFLSTQIINGMVVSLDTLSLSRLLTHQFIHVGITHLKNNMATLLLFGPAIERRMKPIHFILFYLICGSIGGFSQIFIENISDASIAGASSSIFGLLGIFVGMKIKHKFGKINFPTFIIPLCMIVQEVIISLSHPKDKIGHIAHIGGALTGIIIGFFYERFTKTK